VEEDCLAGVGAERIERGVRRDAGYPSVVFLVSDIEPLEGVIPITQLAVELGAEVGSEIVGVGFALRAGPSAGAIALIERVGVLGVGVVPCYLRVGSKFLNYLRVIACAPIGPCQADVPRTKRGIIGDEFRIESNRFIKLAIMGIGRSLSESYDKRERVELARAAGFFDRLLASASDIGKHLGQPPMKIQSGPEWNRDLDRSAFVPQRLGFRL
jgi:hypothetical protein